ncbi:MAG: ParB/RepB/Spo0J family partition protein, partial [Candidatus Saccharibacteria bacterium]|nr:ParB/RepB/Spo0J family partition protein [Candidatus Saccharibacteria bacterium]
YIAIQDIHTNPYQPRKQFSEEKIEELAASIRENGLIQPIIVRKSSIIGYELLAGERRFRAAKLAGLTEIPALVKQLSDDEMMQQAIIENLQREDLNPLEEAESYQHLIERGLTHDEIAKIMGKSRPYITNLVRLLQLPDFMLGAIKEGKISQAHARLLIKYSETEQRDWLEKIISLDLSVRKLENLLQNPKQSEKKKKRKELFVSEEEEKLKQLLGLEVQINLSKHQSGKVIISFSDQEEYERIINSLK